MVRYTLSLHTQSSPPAGYQYPLDLPPYYEDNPEQIFTPEIRQHLQDTLQQQSLCAIREPHLNQIINAWIEDIQEGYRNTTVGLNLPSLFETHLENFQDNGNQEFPPLFPPELTGIEPTFGMLPPLEDIYTP